MTSTGSYYCPLCKKHHVDWCPLMFRIPEKISMPRRFRAYLKRLFGGKEEGK